MAEIIEFPVQPDGQAEPGEYILMKRSELERLLVKLLRDQRGLDYSRGWRAGWVDAQIWFTGGFNGNAD
jgi:hypothetical protein